MRVRDFRDQVSSPARLATYVDEDAWSVLVYADRWGAFGIFITR